MSNSSQGQQSDPDDDFPVVIDEAWEEEILRRLEDIRMGRAKTVDLDTLMQSLRDILKKTSSSDAGR